MVNTTDIGAINLNPGAEGSLVKLISSVGFSTLPDAEWGRSDEVIIWDKLE